MIRGIAIIMRTGEKALGPFQGTQSYRPFYGALMKPRPRQGAADAFTHRVDLPQRHDPPGPGLGDHVGRLVRQFLVEIAQLAPDDLSNMRGGRFGDLHGPDAR